MENILELTQEQALENIKEAIKEDFGIECEYSLTYL